jgi:hypothetical protein
MEYRAKAVHRGGCTTPLLVVRTHRLCNSRRPHVTEGRAACRNLVQQAQLWQRVCARGEDTGEGTRAT